MLPPDHHSKSHRFMAYQQCCTHLQDCTLPNDAKQTLAQFNHLIQADADSMTIEVEGQMTYGQLIRQLWPKQLLPTVIPANKSTTVAEALTAMSVNAGAFSAGPVIESVMECDLWLPNGDILTCRRDNDCRSFFYDLPNARDQSDRILRVMLEARKAKPYVALTHQHFNHAEYFFEKLSDPLFYTNMDFVEATVFGQRDFVITRGQFVDHAPYLHMYPLLKQYYFSVQNRQHDFMSTRHFLWRWNSDRFWRFKRTTMDLLKPRQTPLTRWLLQTRLGQQALSAWQRTGELILKDVFIPAESAPAFLDSLLTSLPMRPFWLCPVMIKEESPYAHLKTLKPGLSIYFGFWGIVPRQQDQRHYNRMIDLHVNDYGGSSVSTLL